MEKDPTTRIIIICGVVLFLVWSLCGYHLYNNRVTDGDVIGKLQTAADKQRETTKRIERAQDRIGSSQKQASELQQQLSDASSTVGTIIEENKGVGRELENISGRVDECQNLLDDSRNRNTESQRVLQDILKTAEDGKK